MPPDSFDHPEYYNNRELSWLDFNYRVLEEAQDEINPLLERLKFLCIVSSNLDEFFEIRVAGVKQQIMSGVTDVQGPDCLTPPTLFQKLNERIHQLVADQYATWNNSVCPGMAENGIKILGFDELTDQQRSWAKDYYMNEVFPVLTPLAIDPSHPFPQLLNKSLNQIVEFQRKGSTEIRYAIVQPPRPLAPIIRLPDSPVGVHHFVLMSTVISAFMGVLFPNSTILGVHRFRITRNSDLYIDDEEAHNLLATIEQELQHRNRGAAVRLEMHAEAPEHIQNYLLERINLTRTDLYLIPGSLNLPVFMTLLNLDVPPHLKDKPFQPVTNPALVEGIDIFEAIRKTDILLHHPYESFNSVTEFVEKAASDPRVLAIKMTLYRTSGDSPIVKALIDAARREKQVTVLVELKARFDEANNIVWARRMEEAGVHVVYGLVGLKTHSKVLLVVRRDEDQIRRYVHLGTGNYHSRTARLYTDLGLFTIRKGITNEVATFFNTLTGMSEFQSFQKLLVAPFNMQKSFVELIDTEIANAKLGLPCRIFAKMNSLVDSDLMKKLFEASCAGVKIDLLIRGICCLRPGIPGVSENITVRSIVGRYLEHSRIFYFENAGSPKVFLGSADWMPRNLYRRVEVVFPVEDKNVKSRIINEVIASMQKDNVKARVFLPDGTHRRPARHGDTPPFNSQDAFMEMAENQNPVTRLIPQATPRITPLQRSVS